MDDGKRKQLLEMISRMSKIITALKKDYFRMFTNFEENMEKIDLW